MVRYLTALVTLGAASWTLGGAPPAVFPRRNAVVAAVEKVEPGVVNISTERIVTRPAHPFFGFRDPFFERYFQDYFGRFGPPRQERHTSLGSGVIIDPEGYVVTNEHVVRRASKISVGLPDGRKFEGKLLSSDADSDLALIKIDADKPLPAVPMGHSNDLMIGETAIALGNPFGLESTVTVGVVSAKNRSVMLGGQEAYAGLIQSDAAINPGNSGGALVNIHGELIGINVAIHAEAEGIGFAIPVDKVRTVLCNLFNYRLVKKTYIGIKVRDVAANERDLLTAHGKDGETESVGKYVGILVTDVDGNSPAAKAGIRPGDAIIGVDGEPVPTTLAFLKRMLKKKAGDIVELKVFRKPKERTARLTVATVPRPSGAQLAREKLGLAFQPMTREIARRLGFRRVAGLLITEVERGGPGDQAGLRAGDVIIRFGSLEISTMERLGIVLEQLDAAQIGLLVVRRGQLYRATLGTR